MTASAPDTDAILSMLPAVTESPEETAALGRAMAPHLVPGCVVGLYGDLGAGKTQFVKGICEALGCSADEVHSPTFTIVNEYPAGDVRVFHFDAYRIERPEEFFDLGYEDYFFGGDGISIVEWADRVEDLLPADAIRIRFLHEGANRRRIVPETKLP
ncbi:MAG TPA: tRNA (adenosine(37)-N6)-threonylcarbamoyltransferase complex ATPase subunit type 1 TsaE [Rhodothermales bacterium]